MRQGISFVLPRTCRRYIRVWYSRSLCIDDRQLRGCVKNIPSTILGHANGNIQPASILQDKASFKVCWCFHHCREEDWLCLIKKSTDWIPLTPFLSDLYNVWKLHSKRKRLGKNSMKFQFVFPGTSRFKRRLKYTLRLSWKYYARGLPSNLSLSCKTKYHYNIYTFSRKWSKDLCLWLQTFYALACSRPRDSRIRWIERERAWKKQKQKQKQKEKKRKKKKTRRNWKRLFMHIIWLTTEKNILGHTEIQMHVRQWGFEWSRIYPRHDITIAKSPYPTDKC